MLEVSKNERICEEKPSILNGGEQIDEKVCESENFDKSGVDGAGEKIDEKIERKFYFQRDKNYAKKSSAKTALVFAIIGLLTGPFVGIGIFFSAAGLIIGLGSGIKSVTKTWAVAISVVGIILNAAFIVALILTLNVYGIILPDISATLAICG